MGGSIFFVFLPFFVLFGGCCIHHVYLGALFWHLSIQLLLIYQKNLTRSEATIIKPMKEKKKKSMMVTPLRSAILKAGQSSMMEPEA